MGKKMLLSSLPVHMEQAKDHSAQFFSPGDSAALAKLLDGVAQNPPLQTPPHDQGATALLNQRRFIDDYVRIIQAVNATNQNAARIE